MFLKFSLLLILSLLYIVQTSVAYKDTIKYNKLSKELQLRGMILPDGNGVTITQVEANFISAGTADFMPNINDSQFSGKTITDGTGGGTSSSHATIVGRNLYGSTSSIAPGITTVKVYESSDWSSNQGWRSGTPPVENSEIQNHSWISFTQDDRATTRMDFAVERDGFLPIAALYNSDYGSQFIPSDIPTIYGSIYNGISVGVSDGTHRSGVTSTSDGPGRIKPEIVAPSSFTSYATPYVSAAAALLIESAGANTDAKRQQVVKALLLAAADKTAVADWEQTPTRPLDDVFGAGQLDVYESYFIQQAGQHADNSAINERGWNFASLSNNSSHVYNIVVPLGFTLRNLSALITWNRTVTRSGFGPFVSYNPDTLANMSLSLEALDATISQTSDSAVDNIEHIWRDISSELGPGDYTLTVSTNLPADYAIAWRSEFYQDFGQWASTTFASTPGNEQGQGHDPDGDGIENLLEFAFGGDPEQANQTDVLPSSSIVNINGTDYLEISYRKPTHQNGLNYRVQTVTDLDGTWTSTESEVEIVAIKAELGAFDRYVYRRLRPISSDEKAFLRVSVTEEGI